MIVRGLMQVQALRGAARRAGVPEHVVTGVRLQKKPPSNEAQECHGDGSPRPAGLAAISDHKAAALEAKGSLTTSSTDSKADENSASNSAAQNADHARQHGAASLEAADGFNDPQSAGAAVDTVSSVNGARQLLYSLRAVVVHHGGPESGHYTTFRCVGERRQWFLTSDMDVWPVAERSVLNSEATLLLYEGDV